jgi:hypothetical protein
MKREMILLLTAMICTFPAVPSSGATFEVKNFIELQFALTESGKNGESDTIKIWEGHYRGSFSFSQTDGAITSIRGGYVGEGEPTNDPTRTVLDSEGEGPVLRCSIGGSFLISNLTIQNGYAHYSGGGLQVSHGSNKPNAIWVMNNIIRDNHADGHGGGMLILSVAPQAVAANILILGNVITGNSVDPPHSGGGASIYLNTGSISATTGQIVVIGNTITDNVAGGNNDDWPGSRGGGLSIETRSDEGPPGKITVSDNVIKSNRSSSYGGGVSIRSRGKGSLMEDPVELNEIMLEGNTIMGNTSGFEGGGIHVYATSDALRAAAITLTQNTISGNSAYDSGGGAYMLSRPSSEQAGRIQLHGNMISENTVDAGYCGGVCAWGGDAILTDNFVVENESGYNYGGVFVNASQEAALTNNTIASNVAAQYGGGLALVSDGHMNVYNNIVWGNSASQGGDIFFLGCASSGILSAYNNDYSGIVGVWSDAGDNISSDPLFAGAHDYHLQWGSPCRNAGTPGAPQLPPTDYDGQNRIMGGAPDMGADEILRPVLRIFSKPSLQVRRRRLFDFTLTGPWRRFIERNPWALPSAYRRRSVRRMSGNGSARRDASARSGAE